MSDEDLHYKELLEVSELIARREVSPVELTSSLLDRIGALDGELGSYADVLADGALEQAAIAEQEIASGGRRGPLHGIPIAIKDIFDKAGTPTVAGMPIRIGQVATKDSTVVRKLDEAGAVLLGKLHLTEGVYAEYVEPFRPPRNPWNPDRWAGASSSGNGVAVAAGLCFGSLGSDTGGSIRLPSAANGVTGIKPTWGRVSRSGVFELADTLDHIGPICRSAADAGAVLAAVAGPDPLDPTASQAPLGALVDVEPGRLDGVVLGLDSQRVFKGIDEPTAVGVHAAIDTFVSLGARIEEVHLPDPTQVVDDWFGVCAVQTALAHRDTYPRYADRYGQALSELIERGRSMTAVEHQRLLLRRAEYRGRIEVAVHQVDALILPAMAFVAPAMERMVHMDDDTISGVHRFTCPFTMSGHPTITMPAGFSADGLPTAVQLVTKNFEEALLVRLGASFQAVTDWHRRHPKP
ncbi:amidase [Rhodococcus zopfii]|uniref:amidase n=1 Tax=Rhodococcus zopfii TaxID=43772 RepID=UPI0011111D63|nr:amidase [Rhodococcus zopfii]